jgi:hypothetical protein
MNKTSSNEGFNGASNEGFNGVARSPRVKMTIEGCYHIICRLGRAQPNPWKCDNYGSTYPLSP